MNRLMGMCLMVVAACLLTLSACGGGGEEKDGCANDNDCKGDRICDGGECVLEGGNNGGNNGANNGGGNNGANNGGGNNGANNGGGNNGGAMCEGPGDCMEVVCPCKDGDVGVQSCLFGECATMSVCADECSDRGGLRDTNCEGEFSLGTTPFVSGENLIGNECDGVPPQNCIDGTYIQLDGNCYCTPLCADAVGVGGNCTDDGAWTCQQVASNDGVNNAAICVHSSWGLCSP